MTIFHSDIASIEGIHIHRPTVLEVVYLRGICPLFELRISWGLVDDIYITTHIRHGATRNGDR